MPSQDLLDNRTVVSPPAVLVNELSLAVVFALEVSDEHGVD